VPVNSSDEIGQMALSFNGMIDNIRSQASSAEAIGKGNYDTEVVVRGRTGRARVSRCRGCVRT
jgi:methyl-accepting chemotaxis protein